MGETQIQEEQTAPEATSGKGHAWLELFRITNAPSVPGDAFAGAALGYLLAPGFPVGWGTILGAGFAALGLYGAGLADNDIVDADEDAVHSPRRPIPSGRISVGAARLARFLAFLAAFAIGIAARLPVAWFISAAILSAVILAYNRVKNRFPRLGAVVMGLCRGGSVLLGLLAIAPPCEALLLPGAIMAGGWTAYVASLTLLAEDEATASAPLPMTRFLPAATALLPILVLVTIPGITARASTLILLGAIMTALSWSFAVWPLGRPHDPETRRRAVGMTIGALLYLQAGFALATALPPFEITIAACFLGRMIARHATPSITGS